ncbi:MAG: hypothetical protein Q8J72_07120 [Rhodocyclaceae bacterium]|nr:hypothetical protein [Rhodocyclaceae bacterium]MDP3036865.1 hypothetical protein [Rhodocyclaceae bacterium]
MPLAGQPGQIGDAGSGEVARVDDGGLQFAEESEQARIKPKQVAWRFVQADELNVIALDAPTSKR